MKTPVSETTSARRCQQAHHAMGYLLEIKSVLEEDLGKLDPAVERILDTATNAATRMFVAELTRP
jgi:hypothetical protein